MCKPEKENSAQTCNFTISAVLTTIKSYCKCEDMCLNTDKEDDGTSPEPCTTDL